MSLRVSHCDRGCNDRTFIIFARIRYDPAKTTFGNPPARPTDRPDAPESPGRQPAPPEPVVPVRGGRGRARLLGRFRGPQPAALGTGRRLPALVHRRARGHRLPGNGRR